MRSHGARQFEKMKRKKVISTDRRFTEPVARVAERLKQVIMLPKAEWEFVVFEDLSPNAFALPGGKVGVNTGLFQIIGDDVPNVESNMIDKQVVEDLQKLITELPDDQREVLTMRLYKDMSFKEIAESTGVSINTALGRMRYAVINIRKLIAEHQIVLSA